MIKAKVYLRGAYGPGNLGDDVLMLCMLNILKRHFAPEDICVGVKDVDLAMKFDSQINWVPIKKPVLASLVIFGGGGQFFSFPHSQVKEISLVLRIKRMLKRVSLQTGPVDVITRLWFGLTGGVDKVFKYRKLAAFCVGLGPFDGSKEQTERAKDIVDRCDYISVRDATSLAYCRDFGYGGVSVFSDPSLCLDLWYEAHENRPKKLKNPGGYYSFVLRDWPYDKIGTNKIEIMLLAARLLLDKGEKVRIVSLYKERDAWLKGMAKGIDWCEWNPEKMRVSEFLSEFIENSRVIVSARAHGVWLPAVLGKPAIAIPIENKLREVHAMLGGGAMLSEATTPAEIVDDIYRFLDTEDELIENLHEIVVECDARVREGVLHFEEWLVKEKMELF